VVECEVPSRGGDGFKKNAGPAFSALEYFAVAVATRYGDFRWSSADMLFVCVTTAEALSTCCRRLVTSGVHIRPFRSMSTS
jgi:hypothetical protein